MRSAADWLVLTQLLCGSQQGGAADLKSRLKINIPETIVFRAPTAPGVPPGP